MQASDGCQWMDCARQIDIHRSRGKLGGLKLYANIRYGELSRLFRGFDIVAIHDVNFVRLRPSRLMSVFKYLKRHNGKIYLTSMSTDIAYLDMVAAPDSPLRYNEWFVNGSPSRMNVSDPLAWKLWHESSLVDYQRRVFDMLDGAVSVLYEYHKGIERFMGNDRVAYGGIPIDTSAFKEIPIEGNIEKVKFFLGRDCTRKLMKGSDLLETAARRVIERYPDRAELTIVENRPFREFVELLKDSHVVLDQIYSYTPATTALMAMSYGRNVVSGAEPEYYDFIGENDNKPIINAPIDIDDLTCTLEKIVLERDKISLQGHKSREFVEKHNACEIVAKRFMDFWTSK